MAHACNLDVRELSSDAGEEEANEGVKEVKPKLGRKRQVVGILVSHLDLYTFIIQLIVMLDIRSCNWGL